MSEERENVYKQEVTITVGERQALIHNQMLDFICTVSEMEDLRLNSRQIQQLTVYIMGSWFKGKRNVWSPINLKKSARWIMDFFEDCKDAEDIDALTGHIKATASETAKEIIETMKEAENDTKTK